MSKVPSAFRSLLPGALVRGAKMVLGWLQGWSDRLLFPVWLLVQCARARRKAVLVWRTAALGDIVCTFPMLAAIRERHPGCLLIYITLRGAGNLVLLSRGVDRVYGINHVYGRPSWLPSALPFTFGAVSRVYEPKTCDERREPGRPVHLVDDMAESCGLSPSDRQPHLYPSPALISQTAARHGLTEPRAGGPLLIGINAGQTWAVREWPAGKWQGLVDRLHEEYDATIIQFGIQPGDEGTYAYRLKDVRPLINVLSPEELTALIAACDLVISIDSGPVHIAGAVGTPVVGLYGAINPLFRLPPRSPSLGIYTQVPCLFCHHRTPVEHWISGCPYDIRCMEELTVEPVLAAARSLLSDRGASPFRLSGLRKSG